MYRKISNCYSIANKSYKMDNFHIVQVQNLNISFALIWNWLILWPMLYIKFYKILVDCVCKFTIEKVSSPWYNAKFKHKQTKIGTQIKPSWQETTLCTFFRHTPFLVIKFTPILFDRNLYASSKLTIFPRKHSMPIIQK